MKAQTDSYKRALRAGVKIAMGTDAAWPSWIENGLTKHGTNAMELELMVKNGLTEVEAIMASTRTAAELLGVENKLGAIKEGRLADILIVRGNPLKDITLLQDKNNLKVIVKNGVIEVDRIK